MKASKSKSVLTPKSKGPSVVMIGSLIFSVLLLIFVVMYMGTSKDTRNKAVNDNDCPPGYTASKNGLGKLVCSRDKIEKNCKKIDPQGNCLEYKPTPVKKCNPLTEKQIGFGADMTCIKLDMPTKTKQVTCTPPLYPAKNQKGNTVCIRKGKAVLDKCSEFEDGQVSECITDAGLAGHQTCNVIRRYPFGCKICTPSIQANWSNCVRNNN